MTVHDSGRRTAIRRAAPRPAVTRPTRGNGELILIVEDEAGLRQVTAKTLEFFGYRVLTAEHGAEAVALYREHGSDIALVLTDMMMPVMDGAATVAALRVINPDILVIAVSGLSDESTAELVASLEVDAFLAKPFTVDEMTTLLARTLRAERPESSPE